MLLCMHVLYLYSSMALGWRGVPATGISKLLCYQSPTVVLLIILPECWRQIAISPKEQTDLKRQN